MSDTRKKWTLWALVIALVIYWALWKNENEEAQAKAEVTRAQAAKEKKVMVGMTKDQVIQAWGRPQKVNSTTSSHGTREQWVYGLGTYVYFDEEGKLTTIQQ